MYWKDSSLNGFDFYSNQVHVSPGDWYVVDYVPLEAGSLRDRILCLYTGGPEQLESAQSILLVENTPSRDFSGDGVVNFEDFARLASVWLGWPLLGSELVRAERPGSGRDDRPDGSADVIGLLAVGTPGWKPSPGPADPNLIYRITDEAGADEITLTVGKASRCIFRRRRWRKIYFPFRPRRSFRMLNSAGSIIPSGIRTIRRGVLGADLASPRISAFDWWGPGGTQAEGIQFAMANVGSPIGDGPAASFVYTAAAAGDVTVSLIDYGTVPSTLESILIHQVDAMQMMSSSGVWR